MTARSNGHAARPAFLESTAIAGVGYTTLTKQSNSTVLGLALVATRNALNDCGLSPADVDGLVSFSLFNDSIHCMAVASALGIPELSYALDLNLGGEAPCFAVMNAAMAVATGLAKTVVVFRALNGRSAVRIGSTRFESGTSQYRYPIGFMAYPQYVAMWARRYMLETGATAEDLAGVAIQQRRFASLNERAIRREPLSRESYMNSKFVVDPFRVPDCTSEVDGACALIVTSLENARLLAQPPVVLQGAAWATGSGAGIDIADFHRWPDFTRNIHSVLADRLWASSGVGPEEMDFAEIYDCFSSVVLFGLEGLGLVGRGEAGPFIRSGETWLDGSLPVNTHGGLLCEGYLHGMNTITEAVLQLQGRCGARQVPKAQLGVVTSGALTDGSALVLRRDA